MRNLRGLTAALALVAACLATASSAWASTVTRIVRKAGGSGAYTTIQAAVNASTSPLAFDYDINVDSSTYAEDVTISGHVMNNHRIRVQSDPNMGVSTRATVNPVTTAAFTVGDDSVTIKNINIYPTTSRSYGIQATGNYLIISSVTLYDNLKMISNSGLYLNGADWADISYSTFAMFAAVGFKLNQSSAADVSYSYFSSSNSTFDALQLWEASSNTFLVVVATSIVANGINMNGTSVDSAYNTFTRSSFTSMSGASAANAIGPQASYNTFDSCYFYTPKRQAVFYNSGNNDHNTIKRSTFIAMDWSQGVWIDGDYNTIEDSKLYSPKGTTLSIRPTATYFSLTRSTVTNPTAAAIAAEVRGASTTISGCYVEAEKPIEVQGATGTVINTSTIYGTDSALPAIRMYTLAQNLTLSSNTIKAGDAAAAVKFDSNDWRGNINIDSNTITVAAISAVTSDQNGISMNQPFNGAATVWITSNTFLPSLLTGRNLVILYMYGLAQGATVQGNDFYYRRAGASGYTTPFYVQKTTGVTFNHNRISNPGMVTGTSNFYGADIRDSHNFTFTYNDIHSTSAITTDILLSLNYTTVTLKNNVFVSSSTAGTLWALKCVASGNGKQQCGINSDYNTFFSSSGGGNYSWADYGGTRQLTPGWVTGKDVNSVITHPQWFSTDIGDEDFHPRSRQGRYRNGSWVTDGTDSPTIDKGDPNDDKTLEPTPSGTAPNQGSYGGTDEASKTYVPRRKQVIVIH